MMIIVGWVPLGISYAHSICTPIPTTFMCSPFIEAMIFPQESFKWRVKILTMYDLCLFFVPSAWLMRSLTAKDRCWVQAPLSSLQTLDEGFSLHTIHMHLVSLCTCHPKVGFLSSTSLRQHLYQRDAYNHCSYCCQSKKPRLSWDGM